MTRVSLFLLLAPAILALAPIEARAQENVTGDRLSAEVRGGAEVTDNVRLVPVGEESDTIYQVTPSITGRVERRGFMASLRYRLDYWHFQDASDLDRALHDMEAKLGLTWFENIDLEAYDKLVPTSISFGRGPLEDPLNNVQANHAGGKLSLRRPLGESTRILAGYTGERVDYLEVHKDDAFPPEYFLHDPGVALERDLGRRASMRIGYRYRLQDFDDKNAPLTGDATSHIGTLRAVFAPVQWVELEGAYGLQRVSYENEPFGAAPGALTRGKTDLRHIGHAQVKAGGEIASVIAAWDQQVTTDVLGNPAEVRIASLGADYTPFAPWGLSLEAAYGKQNLFFDPNNTPDSFVQARAGLSYRISVGTIEATGQRFQSLEGDQDARIEVNRFGLRLGGSF